MAVAIADVSVHILKFAGGIAAFTFLTKQLKSLWPFLKHWYHNKGIPQGFLIQGDPEVGNKIHSERLKRNGPGIYTVKHSNEEGKKIIGISVMPESEDIASPNAKVVSGGLGQTFVEIELEPPNEGVWGCVIAIVV